MTLPAAVRPIVEEVLEGFNCTIFAYGQTGTGKTHTMEGEHEGSVDGLPTEAGVIPRAMAHIFEYLQASGSEYSVKCTFLELYNEEITDLLAPELEGFEVRTGGAFEVGPEDLYL
jgi:kinesin family protein 11